MGQLDYSHLEQIEAHVRKIYSTLSHAFHYHALDHTITVVKATREISHHEGLTDHQKMITEVAAWFHDVGYSKSSEGHEELSSFRSMLALSKMGISFEEMELIEGCILVTRLGSEPKNQMQAVLCDADLYHLSTDDFRTWSEKLRREWQATQAKEMSDEQWLRNNIIFMSGVSMRTGYGQRVLVPRIQANILKLETMLQSGYYPKA